MAKRGRKPKPRPVTIQVIDRLGPDGKAKKPVEPYGLMERMIAEHCPALADAAIGLAWRIGWKPNADNLLKLGNCKRRTDLDRALDKLSPRTWG